MDLIRCGIVGDLDVGKTCLLITYIADTFPTEYMCLMGDIMIIVQGKRYTLRLWDTIREEREERVPAFMYNQTDVFLVCYSLMQPASYQNVRNVWFPEINRCCPNTPIILVGTKLDLRNDKEALENLRKDNLSPITTTEGLQLGKEINAVKYLECSALTQEGLDDVFVEAILVAVSAKKQPERNKEECIVL